MSKKIFNKDELKETHGPMNSVAKDDALVWAKAPINDLEKLDPAVRREVLVKKSKARNSTKKHDRNLSKQIIKNIEK